MRKVQFIGHAVAGTIFLTVSVWWFIGDVLQISETLRAKYKQRGRRREPTETNCLGPTLFKIPLEPLLKVILSAIGILVEVPRPPPSPPPPLQQLSKII